MQSAIVFGLPWLRSGTCRVMEMQLGHLRVSETEPYSPQSRVVTVAGFNTDSRRDLHRTSAELGDKIVISGFEELNPLRKFTEARRAWE